MAQQNTMFAMFRLDKIGSDKRNPHSRRDTRRAPGNVPYVVDNLWEWARPKEFPSRRHCVCASPSAALAQKLGGAGGGIVFKVQGLVGARMAQIREQDAKFHADAKTLHKKLLQLLDPNWFGNAPLAEKHCIAPLWMPCLSRDEVDTLFEQPRLAKIKKPLRDSITFWSDAKLLSLDQPLPFLDGEIFFEATSWNLCP